MSKYYVQSGTMRTVVQAETTRKAALWAVHQAMQQVLPMEGNATDSSDLRTEMNGQDGVAVLSQLRGDNPAKNELDCKTKCGVAGKV